MQPAVGGIRLFPPPLVKDLPEPPRLKATIDDYVRSARSRRVTRQKVAEEFKLRYHFGGKDVITLKTREGLTVIAAGHAGTGEFREVLDSLTAEEHENTCTQTVEPWEEADFLPDENSGAET